MMRFGCVREDGVGGLFEHLFGKPFELVSISQVAAAEDFRTFYSIGVTNSIDNFEAPLDRIPEETLDACRAGRLAIILDNSGEANTLSDKRIDKLHRAIIEKGLPPRFIAYVSHDVGGALKYSVFCRKFKIPQSERIHILYYHKFFWLLANDVKILSPSEPWLRARETRIFRGAPNYKFLCLMHKPRPERIKLALSFLKADLWGDGRISFGGINFEEERLKRFKDTHGRRPISSVDCFLKTEKDPDLLNQFEKLRSMGRVLLDANDHFQGDAPLSGGAPAIVNSIPESLYGNTYFSVVSETEMIGRRHRFTEKTLKPFSSYHPFVVFGNPFSLEAVRELGFETFHSHIDESYDTITNPRDRFDAAFSEVVRLSRLSLEQHARIRKDLFEILQFNAYHYFLNLPRMFEEKIQRPFVNRLKVIFSSPPES